ncbi:MAG: sigma-70 family RNA polymerase sigma factor [Anaerolineae bacterium]
MPDDSLLERARNFDQEALAEIYDRYADKIYQYIFHRVGSRPVAEDLTSDVFVRALEAIERNTFAHTSLRAWLYRVAHNIVVDHYHAQPSQQPMLLDERLGVVSPDPRPRIEAGLAQAGLRTALSRLTDKQHQVIVLRFGEGMTASEVAEVLGTTEGAVRALQHRAVAELRRLLEEAPHD